jgi:triacylglycerol esterase/lipase EstA (alpha/beta hydrolase family)
MMDQSTVSRAFEIARSGTCRTVDDLRKKLKAERCDSVDSHLSSASLTKQLRALLKNFAR